MFRTINVGNKTQEYIETPLVPDDVFAYKIVWNTGEKGGGILKVTALLSDGSVIYDTGTISQDGEAVYVLESSMYSVSGSMELRLSYVSGSSVLTDRILYFNVLEGAGEDNSYAETKYLALDSLLTKANSVLNGASSHFVNNENPHNVTKEQVGLSNVDNTSDMDKPLSYATENALDNNTPLNKVKANNVKKVLLPNLKGNKKIKMLHIGQIVASNISASTKISLSLSSKNLIDFMNINNWKQVTVASRCYTYLDITDVVKMKNGSYPILGLSFDFNNISSLPTYLTILAYSEENNSMENIWKTLSGSKYTFTVGDTAYNKNYVLDFSKVAEYIERGERIVIACHSGTYSVSGKMNMFYSWLSRFKYLQLEYLNSLEDTVSDYNLGNTSEKKDVTVTLSSIGYGGTFISEEELSNLYLDNSGTALLTINTDNSYAAPTDIYVEYYEDAALKYEKMEVDLKKIISTNTAAIIANGGIE